ncbi:MAG: hypothetical protein DMG13_14970 [Acidobacteria bacterium]|nr:MAG: hypothetical protein DMG13_14970 [Acidobacteriota bacterium]
MELSAKHVRREIWCVTSVILMTAWSAYAQGSGTFNGRVLDQGEAVLPGVTVTATNVSTGVTRTTVANEEGVYYLPGLDPGVYDIKAELPGFAAAIRDRVTLTVNATITLDFKLAIAGASETVTVTGAAPLIEVTQSKVVASIQAKEVENLPMITRSVSGLLALLPGATPVVPLHSVRKVEMGSVSFGGSAGRNVIPTVDGADNRDNYDGGPLMNFTQEGLEQFQLATHQFLGGGRAVGGSGAVDGDQVGDECAPRFGVCLRSRSGADREGLLRRARQPAQAAVQPAAVRRVDRRSDRA